jgi:hypothetical protein
VNGARTPRRSRKVRTSSNGVPGNALLCFPGQWECVGARVQYATFNLTAVLAHRKNDASAIAT